MNKILIDESNNERGSHKKKKKDRSSRQQIFFNNKCSQEFCNFHQNTIGACFLKENRACVRFFILRILLLVLSKNRFYHRISEIPLHMGRSSIKFTALSKIDSFVGVIQGFLTCRCYPRVFDIDFYGVFSMKSQPEQ